MSGNSEVTVYNCGSIQKPVTSRKMRKTNKKYPESFFDILSAIFKATNVLYLFIRVPRKICVLGTYDAPLFLDKEGLLLHLIF